MILQCNAIQQHEVNVRIVHILNIWDICRRNRKGAAGGIQSSVTQSQETMAAGLVTEPERVSPSPTAVICIPPSPDLGTCVSTMYTPVTRSRYVRHNCVYPLILSTYEVHSGFTGT